MKRGLLTLTVICMFGGMVALRAQGGIPPAWAYPMTPATYKATADTAPHKVPGSNLSLTLAQINDPFNVADWYTDHPKMPDVVAKGRKPDVKACAYCHLPNGLGHPETARLAGQQAMYLEQQLGEFKSGNRRSSLPQQSTIMSTIAKALTPAEIKEATAYFASLTPKPWVKVVEAAMVPKTIVVSDNMRIPAEPAAMEPLGQRIIEVPQEPARALNRDSHSGYIAYVPVGSLKRGEELVKTGGQKMEGGKAIAGPTVPCATCHNVDLRSGLIPGIPSIAGKSPTFIFRQLNDLKRGTRTGAVALLMQPTVANLAPNDMIALAAYVGSLTP